MLWLARRRWPNLPNNHLPLDDMRNLNSIHGLGFAGALLLLFPTLFIGSVGAQPTLEKLWVSTFDAPAQGSHDTITIQTNKKGNNVNVVEYSTNGGQSWTQITFSVEENGTPTIVTVPSGVIPHGAKVRVQGSNAHSGTEPNPSGSIN